MIREISVSNFKSLKNVTMRLSPLSIFCGPNASGKSNLVEALDFLSQVFRNGLQYGVSEKGGFYNICFRRIRRTKGAIAFRVIADTRTSKTRNRVLTLEVNFSIKARSEAIRAEFVVEREEYRFNLEDRESRTTIGFLNIQRTDKGYIADSWPADDKRFDELFGFKTKAALDELLADLFEPFPQQLLFTSLSRIPFGFFHRIARVVRELEGLHVFQINPRTARQAGVPSVTRGLGKHGENLPIAVDHFLSRRNLGNRLLSWMQDVVPALSSLEAGYTETKQIGLFLHEKGFGAPWYADDLSDGTIMSLALFICLLEPRHRTVVIEEPENCLHPWILKRFLDRCREVSTERQIVITTHSPLVVAAAKPDELYLIERRSGETSVTPALERDQTIPQLIRKDFLDLGDYWMSGSLGAVPEPPEADLAENEKDNL
ncbi:MAG: AAA family ATPase [Candidatus Acidiferrales bacterium]